MASAVSTEDTFGISLGTTAITTGTFTGSEVTNATVSRNTIGSVQQTATYSACGIFVAPAASGTNEVSNNMISGVSANATSGDFTVGILIGGGAGSTKVYFNSVSMSGAATTGSTDKSYALAVGGTNPIIDIRNNILYNTQANGATNYAIGFNYGTPFTNLTSDNNDFFLTGSPSPSSPYFTAGTGSLATPTTVSTLANLQAATGKDLASISGDPKFLSSTNLHISTVVPTPVESAGANVSVIIDIDGDTRLSPPDIGADEGTFIAPTVNDLAATAFIDPTNGGAKLVNVAFSPQASFTNNGTAAQSGVTVRYRILVRGLQPDRDDRFDRIGRNDDRYVPERDAHVAGRLHDHRQGRAGRRHRLGERPDQRHRHARGAAVRPVQHPRRLRVADERRRSVRQAEQPRRFLPCDVQHRGRADG
jgi:hypothetical protein